MTDYSDIPVVLLAGGKGTRFAEETADKPKPLIEIGGKPILHHLIDYYIDYGFRKFFVCCGYKGHMIKDYFATFCKRSNDVRVNLSNSSVEHLPRTSQDVEISMIDTGLDSMTGGRLLALNNHLGAADTFCMTYGDGLSNIDLDALISFHQDHRKAATVTAVKPPARFGALCLDGESVTSFSEKVLANDSWINGGFFVLHRSVLSLIENSQTVWEKEPLEKLAAAGQLHAFKHDGFWHPMDTLRDKIKLQQMWETNEMPWVRAREFAPLSRPSFGAAANFSQMI